MEQSVLGGIIAQAQGDSGLASALRSSFNPLYGHQEALTSTFLVTGVGGLTGYFEVAVENVSNLSIVNAPSLPSLSADYPYSAAINITHVSNV